MRFEEGQQVITDCGLGRIVEVQEWERHYPYRVRIGGRTYWYSENELEAV